MGKKITQKELDQGLVDDLILQSEKGAPNGVPFLNSEGKVDLSQLPTLASTASDISIADTANYYTSTNVEGALSELGQTLNGTRTNIVETAQALGGM